MMMILTSHGGEKVRVNFNRVLHYREVVHLGERSVAIELTDSKNAVFCKETADEIDEMLRTNFVTVYEKK